MDELDARDAFECLGSSLIGVDLARIERRNNSRVGREIERGKNERGFERKVKSKLKFIEGLEEKERSNAFRSRPPEASCARFRANIVPVRWHDLSSLPTGYKVNIFTGEMVRTTGHRRVTGSGEATGRETAPRSTSINQRGHAKTLSLSFSLPRRGYRAVGKEENWTIPTPKDAYYATNIPFSRIYDKNA